MLDGIGEFLLNALTAVLLMALMFGAVGVGLYLVGQEKASNASIDMDVELQHVKSDERYGPITVTSTSFEDTIIHIRWNPTPTGFNFWLTNKTAGTIQINWAESSWVEDGYNRKLLHQDIPLEKARDNELLVPTNIAGNSVLASYIFPSYIVYSSHPSGHPEKTTWHRNSLWKASKAQQLIEKSYRIVLPIQVEKQIVEYQFIFQVKGMKKS